MSELSFAVFESWCATTPALVIRDRVNYNAALAESAGWLLTLRFINSLHEGHHDAHS